MLPIWLGTADGSSSLLINSGEIANGVLSLNTYGGPFNGITRLYGNLLTAKMNIANGADDSAIAQIIAEADIFLGNHNWQGWWYLGWWQKYRVWRWNLLLFYYNHGFIGPGHCG